MNIMRSRAKTFTVEIKRANKRSAGSASVRPTTFDTASDAMLKRIFGNSAALPSRSGEQHARSDDVSDGTRPSQLSSGSDVVEAAVIPRTPELQVRRILPDLLSVVADPVQERMKQQAEQRAARRRALLERRRSKASSNPDGEPISKDRVGPSDGAIREAPQPTTSGEQKKDVLTPAMRKARRAGLRPPRLPLGQRWKRRLPQACW
jgi:hypothetical protein